MTNRIISRKFSYKQEIRKHWEENELQQVFDKMITHFLEKFNYYDKKRKITNWTKPKISK